jgi:hypothetical protein
MGNLEEAMKDDVIKDISKAAMSLAVGMLDMIYEQCNELGTTIGDIKVIPLQLVKHVMDAAKEGLENSING